MKFRGLTSRGTGKKRLTKTIDLGPAWPKINVQSLEITDDTSGKKVTLGPGRLSWEVKPPSQPDPALKGVKGGNCNITACQSPGAHFWNKAMNRYYCHYCATDMHRFALRVKEETLFPNYDQELVAAREARMEAA